ncbi:pyruvate dehydrogenase complex dihydrolipoamide acetyltransferase [Castellaniella sp.]|uniref:pyruvate dehydrogenase complex dihydrolipoamide acetyltransferase n=1 Tax=Castellaniella sp. TaxID=1955812 RepID=UPI002AFE5ACD|nr:pyruvate dehydrogenase complex dihydrolipoamide acetyltransferase [Castellaniella sp.]
MATEIIMPSASASMTEGVLMRWLKQDGETIAKGEILAEVETDKAVLELEAEAGGILKTFVADGDTIKVGAPMGALLAPGETLEAVPAGAAAGMATAVIAGTPTILAPSGVPPAAARMEQAGGDTRIFASPLARRLAQLHGIDLATIRGSGPQGRIVKCDIEAAMGARQSAGHPAAVSATAAAPADAPQSAASQFATPQPTAARAGTPLSATPGYELVPHSSMRRVIAQRLSESKQQVPHFYLSIDCRLDALLALRQQLNGSLPDVKLSVNDFIIKAVAAAMKCVPAANASWSDEGLRRYRDVDVSVAVATPGGLITPVIRQADTKSVGAISFEMKALAERARQSKLTPDEYQGGGFTISNLGMYGIRDFAAIIDPPQACILAVGAAEKRPVVEGDAIIPATVMSCTLSVDHRAVDGAVGAEFLGAFKALLESPLGLLV